MNGPRRPYGKTTGGTAIAESSDRTGRRTPSARVAASAPRRPSERPTEIRPALATAPGSIPDPMDARPECLTRESASAVPVPLAGANAMNRTAAAPFWASA